MNQTELDRERAAAVAASRKARGVVLLNTLRKRQHAWLWDNTEIKVLRPSLSSTYVLYVESGIRTYISHLTEVSLKPKREAKS